MSLVSDSLLQGENYGDLYDVEKSLVFFTKFMRCDEDQRGKGYSLFRTDLNITRCLVFKTMSLFDILTSAILRSGLSVRSVYAHKRKIFCVRLPPFFLLNV